MKEITITITEEQARLIRSAMCNETIKKLSKAFEMKEELKRLGRNDMYLVDIEMQLHEECNKIIDLIDNAN